MRSIARVFGRIVIRSCSRAAVVSARSISLPVASFACKIRLDECPPSCASWNAPSLFRSNSTPIESKSKIRSPASSTTIRTTSLSHRPSPASSVSLICPSISCRLVLSRIAAIPPCAQLVEESFGRCLVHDLDFETFVCKT